MQKQLRTDPSIAGGGYFVDLASHGFDLMQYFFGDITQVHGLSRNVQGLYPAEDVVTATWQFANGMLGSGIWNFCGGPSAR